MSKIKPLARKNDIVIQEFGNEILIYDLKSNKAYNLNETSALIWQLSNGERTISEIAQNLSQIYNSQLSEEFVCLALEQFRKDKLVENQNEITGLLGGVSRREIIRKVGLASLITLPIVSNLVAPTSASAQSSTCFDTCQCPNATVSFCSPSVGAATYPFCQLKTPTATCRCRGPFGPDGSGTTAGQKLGTCATA
jgi:hypothetical protein